jgi:putative ABC transport system permease protein
MPAPLTTSSLLLRSIRHYWRTHLGVVLGTALGAMVLVGALLVGDSVNATLRRQAEQRVGKVQSALLGGDHFFREALGDEVGVAPMLMLRGSVSQADNSGRANQVQVLGVTAKFWELAPGAAHAPLLEGARAAVNERLARQLNLRGGSTLIVRLEKPSSFSKDAPLSGPESQTVALRVEVVTEVPPPAFGNFSLQANQVPPFTIFLPLDFLQERLGLKEKANALLSANRSAGELRGDVAAKRTLADAELALRSLMHSVGPQVHLDGTELRTSRVFLEPAVVAAAPRGIPSLTYLVNELRAGDRMAPYSMATAVDPAFTLLPQKMRDDQVVITQWLAEDLGVAVGGRITLKYFVMGERRKLEETARDFTVASILPMNTAGLDSSWMPDFPGLSDKKNCRDWEPGFAMDNTKIRPKDEQYWTTFRGTPKAFVTLRAGQEMWGNRWGNTTSIRYLWNKDLVRDTEGRFHVEAGNISLEGNTRDLDNVPSGLPAKILEQLPPEKMGMNFVPLREQAFAATKVPVDFGELFLYFSFFLLVAAAVLTGLLFVFSLEQRNEEAGLLLGVGWPAKKVRRLLLGEGAVLAVAGSLLGSLGGLVYTWAVLRALATVWRDAVGAIEFEFSASAQSVAIGLVSAIFVALLSMWLASRRQLRQSVHTLLVASGETQDVGTAEKPARSWSMPFAAVCLVAALGMLAFAFKAGPPVFFGAGALLLIAGIAFALSRLRRTAGQSGELTSLDGLGVRNAARRRGRSVATIAVLASGVFMVVAVDAFRQKGGADVSDRKSGTGGFALLGESASPIYEDLNTKAGREAYGLGDLPNVHFVPMRVREGDDASCLNLNRALQPRLLGVKPADLAALNAFKLSDPKGWALLDTADKSGGAIPAIVDSNTLQWALQKKLGDVVTYLDERGQPFAVRLAGTVAGSILQGSVLISEQNFIAKFPNQGGYRYFLIDAPADRTKAASEELSRGLADYGFEATSPAQRLAELQAVENTYLAIFQALGGLGLLLGSAGLTIVVARNVLERRREFGLLEAVGFRPAQMRALVFAEHRWLIVAGLIVGVGSAIVAVFPSLRDQARGFPYLEMGVLLWALIAGSFFWIWLATRLSLRGERISALRTE